MIQGEPPSVLSKEEARGVEPPVTPPEWNTTIQGLRGFCALIVIISHTYLMGYTAGFFPRIPNDLVHSYVSNLGGFGVEIFFCISGYLILQSLLKYGKVGRFLVNRAIRIYPVFVALHLVMFTLGPLIHYEWMGDLLHSPVRYGLHFFSNLFFLPGIFPLPLAQKNAWSLSYEFAFYLLAGLFFGTLQYRRKAPLLGTPLLLALCAFTGGLLFLRARGFFFLVGVFLFFLEGRKVRLPYRSWQAPLGFVFLVLSFTSNALSFTASWLFGFLFFYYIVTEEGLFSAMLRLPAFRFLGMVSYSLYLVHPFVIFPLRAVFMRVHVLPQNSVLAYLTFVSLSLVLAVSAASLFYYALEVGFTRKYLKKKKPGA
jgi:peptidoglycan/LPS O-acetylase OafA/YrhL